MLKTGLNFFKEQHRQTLSRIERARKTENTTFVTNLVYGTRDKNSDLTHLTLC